MSSERQVAIITGGASGMGLAVAVALHSRGDWALHLLDRDADKGQAGAEQLGAQFHQVELTDYSAIASAFSTVFRAHKKLNFVFANAGIATDPRLL
ncbi:hypothetical protein LTR08_007537 [Meristemomyces frigidus]|nr:hypothetical protein LTR08_007537 [Meristemomyces frigidus]